MEYKLFVVFSVFVASMASETDFRWWSSSNIDMEAALPFVYPKKYFPPKPSSNPGHRKRKEICFASTPSLGNDIPLFCKFQCTREQKLGHIKVGSNETSNSVSRLSRSNSAQLITKIRNVIFKKSQQVFYPISAFCCLWQSSYPMST